MISAVLLVMPIAGLTYILLSLGKKGVLAAIAACRRRPVLCLPYVTAVLLVAAGLAAHWGLLPVPGCRRAAPGRDRRGQPGCGPVGCPSLPTQSRRGPRPRRRRLRQLCPRRSPKAR